MTADGPRAGVRPVGAAAADAAAFLCELAMLAVLAVAGWGLATGFVRWALAVALPVAAAVVWGRWMAPNSPRRLADPARFVAQVLLFALAAGLAVTAGHAVVGISFAVVASAVFALTRVTGGVSGS